MLIPSRAHFFCTPVVGLRAELEKIEGHRWSHLSRGRADAHRMAIVHTLTVDVPFDQISLFELQRRRVMTRQGALVKRTRKKNQTWRTKGGGGGGSFEPSNLCELRACTTAQVCERTTTRDQCLHQVDVTYRCVDLRVRATTFATAQQSFEKLAWIHVTLFKRPPVHNDHFLLHRGVVA